MIDVNNIKPEPTTPQAMITRKQIDNLKNVLIELYIKKDQVIDQIKITSAALELLAAMYNEGVKQTMAIQTDLITSNLSTQDGRDAFDKSSKEFTDMNKSLNQTHMIVSQCNDDKMAGKENIKPEEILKETDEYIQKQKEMT